MSYTLASLEAFKKEKSGKKGKIKKNIFALTYKNVLTSNEIQVLKLALHHNSGITLGQLLVLKQMDFL